LVHELSGVHNQFFKLNAVAPIRVQVAEDSVAVLVRQRQVDLEVFEEALQKATDLFSVEGAVVISVVLTEVLL
jgi:hypothetical protein